MLADVTSRNDQRAAERERRARSALINQGAGQLPRHPWRPDAVPPSAVELVEFALRRDASTPDPTTIEAALELISAARAEIDQLETGTLFAARGHGMTWAQIARSMGLNSPQAVQQRLERRRSRGISS